MVVRCAIGQDFCGMYLHKRPRHPTNIFGQSGMPRFIVTCGYNAITYLKSWWFFKLSPHCSPFWYRRDAIRWQAFRVDRSDVRGSVSGASAVWNSQSVVKFCLIDMAVFMQEDLHTRSPSAVISVCTEIVFRRQPFESMPEFSRSFGCVGKNLKKQA
tara:strand:- start:474 stop:944 length:471 start_codon:yes stop_codon:yes gene_type:complete